MAAFCVNNVSIRGLSACVPSHIEENCNLSFYQDGEAESVMKATGIERRHIVTDGMTGSDLSQEAFMTLMKHIDWTSDSIDALLYVTQTPDYFSPPTVFVLHDRLNLSQHCLCFEINHGCPGWVVGLSVLSHLVSNGAIKRAILLSGDCCTVHTSPNDREGRPLFGDCGTATALEFNPFASPMFFEEGTRSKEGKALYRKAGGYRNPYTIESLARIIASRNGEGPVADEDVAMDSMGVFSFGISQVPRSIKSLCEINNIDITLIDKLVLHQANQYMLKKIAKKVGVESPEKLPMSLRDYGNTEACSIPLTIVSQCADEYSSKHMKSIVSGFGTGLSWATAYFETDRIVCPKVVLL